jgi:hypothetical protein
VACRAVRAQQPLPHLSELLLFGGVPVPDEATLRNLPALVQFWAGWARGRQPIAIEALPPAVQALGICRHSLGWERTASPRFAALARFGALRSLSLNDCWPIDTVAPLAPLTALTRLRCDAPRGWASLKACEALEEVSAIRPRLATLRAFAKWTRLRRLTLTGSGVRSLAGMEALAALEELRLIMLPVDDLSPLAGLNRLASIELTGLTRAHDLTPLGTLRSLRRLVIARAGIEYRDIVHVNSLRPLAAAAALEELTLQAAVVDDGDLGPLADLPKLRQLRLFGDLERQVEQLRTSRPDVAITWFPQERTPGERIGIVFVRPPTAALPSWWIREDLTEAFGVKTNADAEARLRTALESEDAGVAARLTFDTEGEAVVVHAKRKEDARLVARVATQLAGSRTGRR